MKNVELDLIAREECCMFVLQLSYFTEKVFESKTSSANENKHKNLS